MMDHIGTDIQTVEHTSIDHETIEMEYKAKQAAEVLSKHYPDHIWMIGWAPGGVLVIKNMIGNAKFGFTVDCANSFSSSDLAHTVMLAGGELLERLGVNRGKWDGELIGLGYEGQGEVT